MLEVNHLLRKAFLDKLTGLSYQNLTIPIGEEFFTGNPALLITGQAAAIKIYVIIQNQTLNDDSPKCAVNQTATLQLDINTIFPSNSGNSYHADSIAQSIYNLLFTIDPKFIEFNIPDVPVWRSWLESSRTIVQDDNTNRTFRKILLFSNSLFQN